ncbi:MAG: 2-amino-4-hydroxy-6-hydroxymethyldihydropteridine diphosphokinase, partial [Nitrospirae bacterium]|nr:2-amino-4-hydroxy-6-hydroxymethyldihydropteridine diphosphokinase [Nitrospirota bacterium]
MPIVYLSIGSNLGKRKENCEKAISLLIKKGIKVTKRSSRIETEPWGIKDQPKFINMAVEAETLLKPEEFLKILKEIESNLGRGESARWGPRSIDLDILFYDGLILKTPELEIPHPLIQKREFVLIPLCEIAPDKIHPVLKKSVKVLLSEF